MRRAKATRKTFRGTLQFGNNSLDRIEDDDPDEKILKQSVIKSSTIGSSLISSVGSATGVDELANSLKKLGSGGSGGAVGRRKKDMKKSFGTLKSATEEDKEEELTLNIDDIIAKTRSKKGSFTDSLSSFGTRNDDKDLHSSYRSQQSAGDASIRPDSGNTDPRRASAPPNRMMSDLSDEELEAAVGSKIISAIGGGGAGASKLKFAAKKVILSKQLSHHLDEYKELSPDDPDLVPPETILELWKNVAEGVVDQSVDNATVHKALETAKKYYVTSKEGRTFINENLLSISEFLLSQSPRNLSIARDNLGQSEYAMVEKSIRFAMQLANDDLRKNAHKFTAKCQTLEALERILDYKNIYFQDSPPAVRIDKILVFQRIKGYYHLAIYFNARANTSSFPEWELVHRALKSAQEGLISRQAGRENVEFLKKFRKEAQNMCEGTMKHLKSMKLDELATQDVLKLATIVFDIKALYFEYAAANSLAVVEYFSFLRVIIVKLLSTQSVEHKEFGEDLLDTLIESVHCIRPLVRSYEVIDAGLDFVNGVYTVTDNKCDNEGYLIPGVDLAYERVDEETGKKVLLFLDKTFDDGDARWCLSEEHEDEPTHPEYTDYYTAAGTTTCPPLDGWEVSEGSEDPSPTLQQLPDFIPIREEHSSIQEDLARWIVEKKIPDLLLGRSVCPSSNTLITSKIITALDSYTEGNNLVSTKMANLLVSILPSLQQAGPSVPSNAAKPVIPSSTAAIEAAKARLASAERWQETTAKSLKNAQNALMNAKTENQSAMKEVEEARKYLASIGGSTHSNERRSSFLSNGYANVNVGFDESSTSITYDGDKPSMFVNDDSSSVSSREISFKTSSLYKVMQRGDKD